ncbi:MAG: hypothetical protein ACI81F_002233, partial [Thalassolituus oleivorans]
RCTEFSSYLASVLKNTPTKCSYLSLRNVAELCRSLRFWAARV